ILAFGDTRYLMRWLERLGLGTKKAPAKKVLPLVNAGWAREAVAKASTPRTAIAAAPSTPTPACFRAVLVAVFTNIVAGPVTERLPRPHPATSRVCQEGILGAG